jgi:ankyrin repeat protein
VKVLVAAGANLAARDTAHGSTPLIWACGGGHFAVIKYLLDEGQWQYTLYMYSTAPQVNAKMAVCCCVRKSLHYATGV